MRPLDETGRWFAIQSQTVRFRCAYSLGKMRARRAPPHLRHLTADASKVSGWWTVGKEATDALTVIEGPRRSPNNVRYRPHVTPTDRVRYRRLEAMVTFTLGNRLGGSAAAVPCFAVDRNFKTRGTSSVGHACAHASPSLVAIEPVPVMACIVSQLEAIFVRAGELG